MYKGMQLHCWSNMRKQPGGDGEQHPSVSYVLCVVHSIRYSWITCM